MKWHKTDTHPEFSKSHRLLDTGLEHSLKIATNHAVFFLHQDYKATFIFRNKTKVKSATTLIFLRSSLIKYNLRSVCVIFSRYTRSLLEVWKEKA